MRKPCSIKGCSATGGADIKLNFKTWIKEVFKNSRFIWFVIIASKYCTGKRKPPH
jgi:hypothetical protein